MNNPFDSISQQIAELTKHVLEVKEKQSQILATKTPKPKNGYMNKKQVAEFLSCCTSTVDNLARAGKLKRHYINSAVRFKEKDVLTLLETKKV